MKPYYKYEIPEGYEARIEENNVIIQPKQSEDERIRTRLIALVEAFGQGKYKDEMLSYLERQKEYKSLPLELSIEDVETIKTALRESGLESSMNQEVYDKLEKIPASAYYLSTVEHSELYPDGRVERRIIGYLEKQKELKPAEWSEEDENRFRNLIYLVEHSNEGKGTKEGFVKFINRLKSLRPQQKQEWGEEDEIEHDYLCKLLRETLDKVDKGSCIDDAITWLEKLPERIYPHSWKPSEEQIKALKDTKMRMSLDGYGLCPLLQSLIDDLKSL